MSTNYKTFYSFWRHDALTPHKMFTSNRTWPVSTGLQCRFYYRPLHLLEEFRTSSWCLSFDFLDWIGCAQHNSSRYACQNEPWDCGRKQSVERICVVQWPFLVVRAVWASLVVTNGRGCQPPSASADRRPRVFLQCPLFFYYAATFWRGPILKEIAAHRLSGSTVFSIIPGLVP